MTPSREPERLTVPPDRRPTAAQPRWRQDFPIDWPQDEYVSRRDLVKFVLLTSLAFTVGQFWLVGKRLFGRRRAPLPPRAIAAVAAMAPGSAMQFEYPEGSTPRLLVRVNDGLFVAYDQQCTHLTCPVVPQIAAGRLHCPCHEGIFDLITGRPLAGPPQRPLPRITLEVRDGTVYATGVEERTV